MKWMSWLAKLMISTFFVSAITIFTSWYVVHSYLDHVLQQYGLAPANDSFAVKNFVSFLAKDTAASVKITDPIIPNKQEAVKNSQQPPDTTKKAGSDANLPAKSTATSRSTSKKAPSENALPVMKQLQTEQNIGKDTSAKEDIMITSEQLLNIKNNITSEDKMKIFSLIISKVPQEKLQTISKLMEGGVTAAEMTQIKTIVKDSLTPKEYSQLITILDKY